MSMGVHHPYHLDLCADNEDPSQLIIRPGWDVPHVRCFPRTICAWPCLLRQVGMVLGSPYDCVVASLAYANPGSRHAGRPAPASGDLPALLPSAGPLPSPQVMPPRAPLLIFPPPLPFPSLLLLQELPPA